MAFVIHEIRKRKFSASSRMSQSESYTYKVESLLNLELYVGRSFKHIATWRLKTGIMQPEQTSIARQRISKQVSAATDTQTTIEELLGKMCSIRSAQSGYKEEFSWESAVDFPRSKWADSRELSSARKTEKMALWVQLTVGLWREDLTCAVIQWGLYFLC
jgi:hypothetical protein